MSNKSQRIQYVTDEGSFLPQVNGAFHILENRSSPSHEGRRAAPHRYFSGDRHYAMQRTEGLGHSIESGEGYLNIAASAVPKCIKPAARST